VALHGLQPAAADSRRARHRGQEALRAVRGGAKGGFLSEAKSNCIQRSDADAINIAWCGRRDSVPFFVDIDHAAYHGNAKRPRMACQACLNAAIAALRRVDPAQAAAGGTS
jgi:hypothetical protein